MEKVLGRKLLEMEAMAYTKTLDEYFQACIELHSERSAVTFFDIRNSDML